ncbi:sensor histidine kinase [Pedobacter sp.]|uniref:sensor histidine kinase n=1 Tax=Pedobacter sp. TaxID=1411316 RepID=UPI003BAAB64B
MLTYSKSVFTSESGQERWKKVYSWQIAIWVFLICYELATIAIALGTLGSYHHLIGHYLINIGFFYAICLVVLPNSLEQGWHGLWRVPLFFIMAFSSLILLKYGLDVLLEILLMESKRPVQLNRRYISGTAWRGLYFVILAFMFYFFRVYVRERNSREDFEKKALTKKIMLQETTLELSKAKHAYLKAQINPHFLFNTLNYVFSLTQSTQPDVARAVVHLSNIMRFAMEAEYSERSPELREEVEHAENYISLWQIPKSGTLQIRFEVEPEVLGLRFIPLIILSLLENIFKHGNLSVPGDPAVLSIYKEEGRLIITSRNLVNTGLNDSGMNLGIENIKSRISAAYGERSECEFKRTKDGHFISRISVEMSFLKN